MNGWNIIMEVRKTHTPNHGSREVRCPIYCPPSQISEMLVLPTAYKLPQKYFHVERSSAFSQPTVAERLHYCHAWSLATIVWQLSWAACSMSCIVPQLHDLPVARSIQSPKALKGLEFQIQLHSVVRDPPCMPDSWHFVMDVWFILSDLPLFGFSSCKGYYQQTWRGQSTPFILESKFQECTTKGKERDNSRFLCLF